MIINQQMTETYGINDNHCCGECAHFGATDKSCAIAKAGKIFKFWAACGKFEEVDQ